MPSRKSVEHELLDRVIKKRREDARRSNKTLKVAYEAMRELVQPDDKRIRKLKAMIAYGEAVIKGDADEETRLRRVVEAIDREK